MKNDTPGKWRQIAAGVIVNLTSLVSGVSSAWLSTVTQNLQKEHNELGIQPVSDYDASWALSIGTVGALAAMIIAPYLNELLGRKKTIIIQAILMINDWLLKLFATDFNFLLIAEVIAGVSFGLGMMIVPIYITEIASNSIRGSLGSFALFGVKSGYLLGFVLAAVLPYHLRTGCTLIAPVIQILGMLLLPETPIYLIRNDKIEEARRSLMWYRGNEKVTAESELLELEQFHKKIIQSKSSLGIKDLFTDRVNLKGLMIGFFMVLIQQTSGICIMIFYIVTIIERAKTSLNSHTASIIYASTHLFGCWISTLTVDRFGRRPLLFLSTFGMAMGHTILGTYFTLQYLGKDLTGFSWVPVAGVCLYGLTYAIGAGPLATVVANEVFNPELASISNSLYLLTFNIVSFLYNKFFPSLTHTIGFHNCFFIFVTTCLIGFFIVLFIIPETKGKSIEAIRDGLR